MLNSDNNNQKPPVIIIIERDHTLGFPLRIYPWHHTMFNHCKNYHFLITQNWNVCSLITLMVILIRLMNMSHFNMDFDTSTTTSAQCMAHHHRD